MGYNCSFPSGIMEIASGAYATSRLSVQLNRKPTSSKVDTHTIYSMDLKPQACKAESCYRIRKMRQWGAPRAEILKITKRVYLEIVRPCADDIKMRDFARVFWTFYAQFGSACFIMSREDRINQALSQLVEHIVPVYPDDDEAAVDERLDQAYEHARQIVDSYVVLMVWRSRTDCSSANDSVLSDDAHHAADLIRKKRTFSM